MMYNYFSIDEFMIVPAMRAGDHSQVPLHVVNKIVEHHLPILNPIRHELGGPLIVSQHSGYRPIYWEFAHGRDGSSQHTYSFYGAVDLTCAEEKLPKLMKLLIDSDYPRVCRYPGANFFHCDFKYPGRPPRYFENGDSGWEYRPDVRK